MALTFSFISINDLYEKLKRDASALEHEVTSDYFFNFVVTGYSMIDWVKNDPYVPYTAKSSNILEGLYNDQWLKVCGDLATACKHYTLSKRKPITLSAIASSGFGVGRFGNGGYGFGEESIEVQLSDGSSFYCLDLVRGVLLTWQTFFSTHGI